MSTQVEKFSAGTRGKRELQAWNLWTVRLTLGLLDWTHRWKVTAVRTEIPEPWSSAMTKAGFLDPRYGNPSLRQLAEAAGVHTTTVSNLVLKGKVLSARNMRTIATTLGVELGDMTRWVTGERTKPYQPPAEADYMTERQRNAVTELILAFTAPAPVRTKPAFRDYELAADKGQDNIGHDEIPHET